MKNFNDDEITNEKLIDELKKLSLKLGKTPSTNDMKKYGNEITKKVYLYRKRFGNMQDAQKMCGLKANVCGKDLKYDPKYLLSEIISISEKLNMVPTQEDISKYGRFPIGAYKRHFGTYNNALKKLNLKHNIKFGQTIDEIKSDIIRVCKLLGRAPTTDEFSKYSETVTWITAANKIVGNESWNSTLVACGLEVIYNKNLTDEELKNEILRLKELLGRIPGYYDMMQLGKYSPETYANKYKTYTKALEHFGFNYIKVNKWHNQTQSFGKDGTCYRSKFESLIANILLNFKNNGIIIDYIYEKEICKDRHWTCDFYIITKNEDIWLEADGMGKNRPDKYDDEHSKIKYYINNNKNFYILRYKNKNIINELLNLVNKYG